MRFGRTKENPLEYDAIIVDEASMIDLLSDERAGQCDQTGNQTYHRRRFGSAAVGQGLETYCGISSTANIFTVRS